MRSSIQPKRVQPQMKLPQKLSSISQNHKYAEQTEESQEQSSAGFQSLQPATGIVTQLRQLQKQIILLIEQSDYLTSVCKSHETNAEKLKNNSTKQLLRLKKMFAEC
ncbi:Hypothetical_protein [Hexamita inflata]|uniref:Hypothetical_protein n=1 Tax=Hexamita inflata TaxID=28002 RepID=A0AA86UXY9_9EUKA|nr:Hypothetical protein HINF_LOCUS1185 [Hexamita inflata]CAI9946582.1 Hypothetical protein HINF_LOCUS34227 [Hexamita inflata]CAI9947538.1 Hypothetical protein HINF_LOCUS35183 [Hexamita inflata]CAI9952438.1 Hypothetical protein HINF_LOCUS40083 [Hexamita inflata]